MMGDEISVVELFAGVGGFRVGLERASSRFKTIWANQWEPGRKTQFAFKCYDANFKKTGSDNINEDIATAKTKIPKQFDLLVGGFPCQDYSVASTNAKGIEGKKGVLWWHIREIIESRKPKFVLLENVDRILRSPSTQRGRDFGIMLRCFSDLEYSVEWRVINAADYGFPQKRRRAFIFACRNDSKHYANLLNNTPEEILMNTGFFSREFPIEELDECDKINIFDIGRSTYPDLTKISDCLSEQLFNAGFMINSRVYTRNVKPHYEGKITTLREILEENVDEHYYQDDTVDKWREMKGSKKLVRTNKLTGTIYNYSEGAIPFPDNLNSPGRTMLTSEGSKNRSSHLILDPVTDRFRVLTPVECERLNGFKENWTQGSMTERQRYFTMGNALVVGLVEKMGREILSIYDQDSDCCKTS